MQADRELRHANLLVAAGALVLFVCFAFVVRRLNQNVGFGNAVTCDAWYFFGLQFNFADAFASRRFYQPYRYPAVLPWAWLGNTVSYVVLNYAKFFFYYAVISGAFLWTSIKLFGRKVGVLTAALFCCSPALFGVLSHDYVTSAGLAWASMFLALTVQASASRRPFVWSMLAGMFFALCVHTHLPTVMFVFAIPIMFLAYDSRGSFLGRAAQYSIGALVGTGVVVVGLGLYNKFLEGQFFYLGHQIEIALQLSKSADANANTGRINDLTWIKREGTVSIVMLTIALGLALLVRERGRVVGNVVGAAALTAAVTSVFVFGYELSGRILLQYEVYSPWIMPVAVVAVGAALYRVSAIRSMPSPLWAVSILTIFIVCLASNRYVRGELDFDPIFAAKMVALLQFLVACLVLHKSNYGIVALVPIGLFMAISHPTMYGSAPWTDDGPASRRMHIVAAETLKRYQSLKHHDIPAFWINASPPDTLGAPRAYLKCGDFAGSFPATTQDGTGANMLFPAVRKEEMGTARHLVILAEGKNLYEAAKPVLDQIGVQSRFVGEWSVTPTISMTVLKIQVQQ